MKKKLLFLINTLRDGGAEKILVDVVNNLNPEKYDIEVKLIKKRGPFIKRLNSNIKLTYITDDSYSIKNRIISRLLPMLPNTVLHKIFIKDKYDIEIAFLEGYATKIISGAKANVNTIAWVHTNMVENKWTDGVFKNEAEYIKAYNNFNKIICVSQGVKESMADRFGKNLPLYVKYNPIDSVKIKELADEKVDDLTFDDGTLNLISIGRFVEQKNFTRLINVTSKLIKGGYKLKLCILGEGEEREKIEKLIKENNCEAQIILPGFRDNPYKYIKNSDVFVCSSNTEGFSTVVTEATVLCVPTVTTDCAGMREILGDSEYGIVTDNSDEGLENGLRKILENPQLLNDYREKAKERSAFFELDKRLKEVETVFE